MTDFLNNDIVRLGCVQELDGLHEIVNVLNVKIVSGGPMFFAAAAEDFGEYCDDAYALISASISDLVDEKHISIKNLTQTTVWGNIAWPTYTGGSQVAEAVAPQVACLGFGRTSISRVQIRKYLGLFTELNMTDGVWDGTVRGACENFMAYHITEQTMTNGLHLLGIAYRVSDGRVTEALSAATSANPVIQRRRRRGRGS